MPKLILQGHLMPMAFCVLLTCWVLRCLEHVMQGSRQSQAPASGLPILQLAWNSPKHSSDPLLLACRTSCWLCIYEAMAPDPGAGRWMPKQQPKCVAFT